MKRSLEQWTAAAYFAEYVGWSATQVRTSDDVWLILDLLGLNDNRPVEFSEANWRFQERSDGEG